MDKPVIKDIKKRMEDLVILNSAAATKVDCGLHTMQAINFLSIVVQCLAKIAFKNKYLSKRLYNICLDHTNTLHKAIYASQFSHFIIYLHIKSLQHHGIIHGRLLDMFRCSNSINLSPFLSNLLTASFHIMVYS